MYTRGVGTGCREIDVPCKAPRMWTGQTHTHVVTTTKMWSRQIHVQTPDHHHHHHHHHLPDHTCTGSSHPSGTWHKPTPTRAAPVPVLARISAVVRRRWRWTAGLGSVHRRTAADAGDRTTAAPNSRLMSRLLHGPVMTLRRGCLPPSHRHHHLPPLTTKLCENTPELHRIIAHLRLSVSAGCKFSTSLSGWGYK